ncbi:MAG: hypothetical protein HUU46_16580 [Candidatus Hydrogenedentes bacterium]|nr:hypothetical protein [Candidatus Hydrogenedentota bacterium]
MIAFCPPGTPAFADSSFGDPAPVNTNADSDVELDGNPSVASDGAGNLVTVWTSVNLQDNGIGNDGDIFAAYSSDGGANWSDPIAITTDDAADQGPAVATDGAGNWVVAWSSDNDLGGVIGIDYDILFSRSTDNGQTWSAPTFLNSLAPTSNAGDFDITVVAGGPDLFIAAWSSNANVGTGTDNEIHYSRSKNGGGSWSDEAALNPDASSDATKYDQMPALASDGAGNWVALWLGDGQDSIYDVLSARSTNDGKSWKNQTTAGSGSGKPSITTDELGNWAAVWHLLDPAKGLADDDNDIVVARSTDNGDSWSTPDFVNSEADSDAHNDYKPSIATDANGRWIAVWASTNPLNGDPAADFDIHTARSTDNGATWTNTKQLHNNAATDLGSDTNPVIVNKGDDDWFVGWESYEPFTDLGSDADILSVRAFPSTYTITNPNGGEEWKIGKKGTIQWDSSESLGKVKLILLKGGVEITTIKSKTKDKGEFKWEVPAGVGTGNNFRVRIEQKNDSNNADESDANFTIKSGKSAK